MKSYFFFFLWLTSISISFGQESINWNQCNNALNIIKTNSITLLFDAPGILKFNTDIIANISSGDTIRINKISESKLQFLHNNQEIQGAFSLISGTFNLTLNETAKPFKFNLLIPVLSGAEHNDTTLQINSPKLISNLNLYYDALNIRHLSKNQERNKSKIESILKKYAATPDNKFLSKYLNEVRLSSSLGSKNNILSKAGGLDVTNISDGIVKHIIAQFRKEMTYCFFDNFRIELNKPEYKDLQILFNRTYHKLDLIGKDIYDLKPYISSLRQDMEDDMNDMITSFSQVVKDPNLEHINILIKIKTYTLYYKMHLILLLM
ncbi:MAG: hypothetical protein IPO92_16085 [Saprospiraceae bacterium]|nr:hypothetical protein [Saprospiraceae bacterium]